MSTKTRWVTLLLALVFGGFSVLAQEHPKGQEHPKEHPSEHPHAKGQKKVTTADLEKAIKARIDEKTKADGGVFKVEDPVTKKTWDLHFVKVHTDKLTPLSEETYFACTDFKAADGTLVDVDFYLKNEDGKLAITDTAIHKVNGKPRFNYVQKGKVWQRQEVKS
jgi:hypothetical protein